MPNRFNNIYDNQYVSQHVPLPFEELVALGAMKQGKQDQAVAEKEQYLAKTWNRLGPDADNARKLKEKTDKAMANFQDKDFTDPQVRSEWYKTKVALANEWGPDGAVGAQEANFNAYQAKKKELDAMLAKKPEEGGITKDTYDYVLKKGLDDYRAQGGIGEKGVEGYKQINFETPALNPDIDKQVIEATKDWKSNAESHGYWQTGDGQWARKGEHGIEYIDPNEVKNAVLADIKARPENQAYAKQQADIAMYGKDETAGTDAGGNPISVRPGYYKEQIYNNIFEQPANLAAARVGFTKTTQDQDIKENQAYLDDRKKKAENYIQPFTVGIQVATTASKYTDPTTIATAKDGIDVANTQELSSADKFIKDNNISSSASDLLKLAAKGAKISIDDFHGALGNDGVNHRDAIGKYLMAIQQNNRNKADIEDYDNKIKKEAGISQSWKPNENLLSDSYRSSYANNRKSIEFMISSSDDPETIKNYTADLTNLDKMYQDAMKKADPSYQKYTKALEENASKQTATIGVTNFTDKQASEAIAAIMTRDLNENGGLGAKDLKTGDDIKDYSNIGKINASQLGWTFDPESGELMIISRPDEAGSKPTDGKKVDYIKSKAPEGVLMYLLNNKDVTAGEVAANQILTTIENKANRTEVMDYNGTKVKIEAIFPTDKPRTPDNTQYKITAGDREEIYTGRQNAITALKVGAQQ